MKLRKHLENNTQNHVLNCLPSERVEDNWTVKIASSIGALSNSIVPESVDLRETWWKVGDQGQTGSCVGWALADGVLRWHFVNTNRLAKAIKLSVRQVWISAKETDVFDNRPTTFIEESGTSLKAALTIAKNHGVVTDEVLPFTSHKRFNGTENEFYGLAATRQIKRYFDLTGNLEAWKKWLAQNGPLLTCLDVDNNWNNADRSGKLEEYDASSANGGHAVAIVGYTPSHFIVRNSWGTSWGDGGYAYVSNNYALDAFTEVYGVAA